MDLGNSLQVVASVYVVILLPWAFLYLHDFISDRWVSVRQTEINGIIHLVVVFIPLPVLFYYIYLQRVLEEPDYKEMFAAVTASVFSIYHFARTVWGLYQLRQFRSWACQTAAVMESASYECKLSSAAYATRDVPFPPELPQKSTPARGPPSRDRSLFPRRSARAYNVPPPSPKPGGLDGTISLPNASARSLLDVHVDTGDGLQRQKSSQMCSTHDIWNTSPEGNSDVANQYIEERNKRILNNVNRMVVNSSIIDNEFIGSYAPWKFAGYGFHPSHKKGLFVRWVVVYLAHFGKEWLEDCNAEDAFEDSWRGRRWRLAAKVWATAALRMETECSAVPEQRGSKMPCCTNVGARSFLDPDVWSLVSSFTEDQIFDRERVLRGCFSSGDGLPYGREILDTPDGALPSHGLYRPLIKEAIESLPTRFYEDVENITPDHLDWFASFVWVKRWEGCVAVPTGTTHVHTSGSYPSSSHDLATSQEAPRTSHQKLASQDVPVQVLRDQLGFDVPPKLEICGFPILKSGYGRNLWENRSVLQVSARIDNWVALCVGRQYAFLLSNESNLGPGGVDFEHVHGASSTPVESPKDSEGDKSESNDAKFDGQAGERSHQITTFHKNLEVKRLRYQLANSTPQYDLLEHGLTFMGCVIESLRSGIAEALLSGYSSNDYRWQPSVPRTIVSFPISEQLRQGLIKVVSINEDARFDSTMQERLLWECQNGVYWTWQNKLKHTENQFPDPVPETAEAMMLCMLGFPSLQVTESNQLRSSKTFRSRGQPPLQFEIRPVLAPQSLFLNVKVDIPTALMTVSITNSEVQSTSAELSALSFKWQDWRDAIEGRMIGKSTWHKSHYMRDVAITQNTSKISVGIEPVLIGQDDGQSPVPTFRKSLVWRGWGPFRAGMSLFELRHSSLIIVGDNMPNDSTSFDHELTIDTMEGGLSPMLSGLTRSSENLYPDAYETASMAALTDASLFLNSLLTLNKVIVKGVDELTQNIDDDDSISTFVERMSPQSSSSEDTQFRLGEFKVPLFPRDVIEKAQEQDPNSMQVLAKWMLTGTKGLKKDYSKALLLLERALILGRNMHTASLLVKTLLDKNNRNERPVDVDRALAAVELLWRDIGGRHELSSDGKKRKWKGDRYGEEKRMRTLVGLHLQLIDELPTAEMMRTLADHLSTWGDIKRNDELATKLYETAILAAQDPKAMTELGRKFHRKNPQFAVRMYIRAVGVGQEAAARGLLQLVKGGTVNLTPSDCVGIYETGVRFGLWDALRDVNVVLAQQGHVLGDAIRKRLEEEA